MQKEQTPIKTKVCRFPHPKATLNSDFGSSLNEDFIFDPTPNSSTATQEGDNNLTDEKMEKLLEKYRFANEHPGWKSKQKPLDESPKMYTAEIREKLKNVYNATEFETFRESEMQKLDKKEKKKKEEKNYIKKNKEDFKLRMSEDKRRVIRMAKEKKRKLKEIKMIKQLQVEIENKRRKERGTRKRRKVSAYISMKYSCRFISENYFFSSQNLF